MKRFLTLFMLACLVFGAASTATADARPSYQNGFARSPSESARPQDWNGLVGLWVPTLSPTGLSLFDWSRYKNHGTLTNMAPATDWVVDDGYALDFDGGNDHVILGTLGNFGSRMAEGVTAIYWINTTGTGSTWAFGARNSSTTTRLDSRLNSKNVGSGASTGAIQGRMVDESGNTLLFGVHTDTGITDGRWHCIAVVWLGPTDVGKIYLDGVAQTVVYTTQTTPATFANFTRTQFMAGFNDGAAPAGPYLGKINQMRFYLGEIPANQLKEIYQDPLGIVRLADTQGVRSIQDVAAASSSQIIVIAWLGVFGSLTMLGFIRRKKPNAR